jgi:hypothetical protein
VQQEPRCRSDDCRARTQAVRARPAASDAAPFASSPSSPLLLLLLLLLLPLLLLLVLLLLLLLDAPNTLPKMLPARSPNQLRAHRPCGTHSITTRITMMIACSDAVPYHQKTFLPSGRTCHC